MNHPKNNPTIPALLRLFMLMLFGFSLTLGGTAYAQEAPPKEEKKQEEKAQPKKDKDFSKKKPEKDESEENSKDKEDAAKDKKKSEAKDSDKKDKDETEKKKQEEAKNNSASSSSSSSRSRNRRRFSRRTENTRLSASFLKAFEPVIADTVKATVKVKCKDSVVAFGAIVGADGYVLTKHSELKRPISVELSDGKELAATVFGVHKAADLALLKIEASDSKLATVRWASDDNVDIGNWLATVSDTDTPLAVGVVGVRARLIKPESGFMGVNLNPARGGILITNVVKDSPAEKGGVKVQDIIVKVNDTNIDLDDKGIGSVQSLQKIITSFPPGEEVRLTVLRKKREIFIDIVLGERRALDPSFSRSNQQNTMGGNKLSRRRQNFEMAVQHDAVLKPEQCGGPVVNIDGEVVGINIAREGRVSSLMLPSSLVLPIVAEMKAGKLNPVLVHRERIESITEKLQNLNNIVNRSPMNDDELEKEVKDLAKKEKELRKQLEETLQKRIRREVELEQASKEFDSAKAEAKRLTKEREELTLGARK